MVNVYEVSQVRSLPLVLSVLSVLLNRQAIGEYFAQKIPILPIPLSSLAQFGRTGYSTKLIDGSDIRTAGLVH